MIKIRIIIQSLIPWIIFFALDDYGNPELTIAIIAAIGFIVIINHRALRKRFILDWGSLVFFLLLLVAVVLFRNRWFVINAPLLAIYSLASITWLSIIIRTPIIMQYARLNVAPELWNNILFYRTNNIITLLWALILSMIALLGTIQKFVWGGSLWLNELLPTCLLLLGIWFTFWFPDWYKRTIIGEWGVMSLKNISNLHISHSNIANIAFRTLGKGQRLIMLLPSHMNMYGWDPELLRILAKKYQVIIIDYPDIGESKLKRGEYTTQNIANAIAEFIKNTGREKVALLGYSLGGWLAQEIAIRHADLIDKLVLVATDVGSPRTTLAEKAIREILLQQSSAADVDNKQFMELMFPEKSFTSLLPKIRAIFTAANFKADISNSVVLLQQHMADQWYRGPGSYAQLGEIDANTLIITGAQDKIVHRQNALLLANGIRGAQVIEFPDAGHGVIYQHPTIIAEAINKLK